MKYKVHLSPITDTLKCTGVVKHLSSGSQRKLHFVIVLMKYEVYSSMITNNQHHC